MTGILTSHFCTHYQNPAKLFSVEALQEYPYFPSRVRWGLGFGVRVSVMIRFALAIVRNPNPNPKLHLTFVMVSCRVEIKGTIGEPRWEKLCSLVIKRAKTWRQNANHSPTRGWFLYPTRKAAPDASLCGVREQQRTGLNSRNQTPVRPSPGPTPSDKSARFCNIRKMQRFRRLDAD